ncbi:MAG TPA: RDD family protein [Vicinamibacterales bacterium]|nr:RDD family protein [Vicinamibacterales bacterium]
MTLTRLHVLTTCLLLLTLGSGGMSAQRPRAEAAPEPQVEASAPPQRNVEDEVRRAWREGRSIVRIAQSYTLPAGEMARDIRAVFGDVTIDGVVGDDVVVVMGSVRLGSSAIVNRALVVIGGSATIEPGAVVRRDLVVVGGTVTAPDSFSSGGEHVVIGSVWIAEVLRNVLPWITRGLLWGRLIVPDLGWVWGMVGIFFLVYLALNTVLERPVAIASAGILERPFSIFVTGLLVLLLSVPALAIIAASVIGLAIVPFLLCALIVAALVGKTAVARAMGDTVLRAEAPESRLHALGAFVIGFAVLTFAYMIPVLGFVTWALTTVLGLGAATVTLRSYLRRERRVAKPAPESAAVAPVGAVAPADALSTSPGAEPGAQDPSVEAPAPVVPPLPPRFTQGLAQYPRASFLDRVAAFVIDLVLVALVNALLDLSRHDGAFFLLLLTYHIAFWAWRGTTVGGIITNLRVVRTHGVELRPVDAVVRGLSGVFSIAALGIGCLWMLQDAERQMWHDKIAGTLVVKVPPDLVLP